jgi:hypothetical protein
VISSWSARGQPDRAPARQGRAGDFNAESDEVPVQVIRGDVENTGNA